MSDKKKNENIDINQFEDYEVLDQEYIVEKILEKKKMNGIWKYKVKWENYSEEECTWEPKDNLKNVKYLIQEFEDSLKDNTKSNSVSLLKKKTNRNPTSKDDEKSNSVTSFEKKPSSIANGAPTKNSYQNQQKDLNDKDNQIENKSPCETTVNEFNLENSDTFKNKNLDIIKGSIDKDIPIKIINAKILDDLDVNINCLVKWKVRSDGYCPEPEWISSKILKIHHPSVLFDFYESRIKFPKKEEK